MKVKIYGRTQGCKYCDQAKAICESNGFDMEFIDIEKENLGIPELSELCGEPVRSVPQIFVDDKFISGGATGFIKFLKGE